MEGTQLDDQASFFKPVSQFLWIQTPYLHGLSVSRAEFLNKTQFFESVDACNKVFGDQRVRFDSQSFFNLSQDRIDGSRGGLQAVQRYDSDLVEHMGLSR